MSDRTILAYENFHGCFGRLNTDLRRQEEVVQTYNWQTPSWPLRPLTQTFLGLRLTRSPYSNVGQENVLYLRVNEFSRKVIIEDTILPLLLDRGPPF